ncbi:CBS domain-containing protein [Halomarina pelagica]|uniref:CBS domain-containing protein n=1 Tax=Halomarina pelagica TaxID=2961599 RepID=UPI0020C3405C|nr:CBS domain-containing protein [Halomarina sp. BND7]
MDGSVTVRDAMTRTYVGVTEGDTLAETAELLVEEDATCAVVLRGREPIGVVGQADVLAAYVRGDADRSTVSDVMNTDVATVPPGTSVRDASNRFTGQIHRLLVTDGDELLGVLTERDILTVPHGTDSFDDEMHSSTPNYGEQGICEGCGTLTRSLEVADGLALCADCRDT